MMKGMAGAALPQVSATISASTSNVNLFTLCGSPAYRCVGTITINTGVIITGSGGNPPLRTGGFTAGSTVKLINNGSIYGYGGAGASAPNGEGNAGGDAIELDYDLTIDNTNGYVFAGGGGGAGGYTAANVEGDKGGGGGGGGQGSPGGGKGYGDEGGADGGDGSVSGPGAGGERDIAGKPPYGWDGAAGGTWGQDGGTALGEIPFPPYWSSTVGGASGNAIRKNGHTVTWTAGNNSTQVKGPQT